MQRGKLFEPEDGIIVEKGATVVHVSNSKLAACLLAVGVPLCRPPKDDKENKGVPPYVRIKLKDGSTRTTYNFYPQSTDGVYSTSTLCRAWKNDLDYISDNPDCPFAASMATVKNLEKIQEHFCNNDLRPRLIYVAPSSSGKVTNLVVVEGSKKHKAAIARGYKQK